MNKDEVMEIDSRVFQTGNIEDYYKAFNDERDKYIKDYVFEDGMECAVYYPPNITEDTKVVAYYAGGGNKQDWYHKNCGGRTGVQDYLLDGSCDSIVIMPMDSRGIFREREVIGCKVAKYIQDEYNLNSDSVAWSGWSYGGSPCVESPVVYKTLYPETNTAHITCAIDGYNIFGENPESELNVLGDVYKDSNNVLFAIEDQWRDNGNHHLEKYARSGINVIKAVYKGNGGFDMETPEGRKNVPYNLHFAINSDYFRRGFMDYTSGHGELPEGDYIYYTWDEENESWKEIPASEISTREKLMAHFGIEEGSTTSTTGFGNLLKRLNNLKNLDDLVIKTDDESVQTGLNGIRHAVKGTSFVKGGIPGTGFSSTTQVPSGIPGVIASYFGSITTLLESVTKETQNFVNINEAIKEEDKKLKEEAEELNDKGGTKDKGKDKNKDKDKEESTPSGNDGGGTPSGTPSGNDGGGTPSGNDGGGTPSGGGGGAPSGGFVPPEIPKDTAFPIKSFDSLTTNDNTLVYSYADNCKIVIHNDGTKLIGLEHYYKIPAGVDANKFYNNLRNQYSPSMINSIDIQGDSVRVHFRNSTFNNLDLSGIKNKYKNLTLI